MPADLSPRRKGMIIVFGAMEFATCEALSRGCSKKEMHINQARFLRITTDKEEHFNQTENSA